MNKHKGFTLIEMIVTVVVVWIFLAIVFGAGEEQSVSQQSAPAPQQSPALEVH